MHVAQQPLHRTGPDSNTLLFARHTGTAAAGVIVPLPHAVACTAHMRKERAHT